MNCPSRVDHDGRHEGWNQNPPALAADTTTRNDLNHMANSRRQRCRGLDLGESAFVDILPFERTDDVDGPGGGAADGTKRAANVLGIEGVNKGVKAEDSRADLSFTGSNERDVGEGLNAGRRFLRKIGRVLLKYAKFIGPGFMVAVAYIDPGNYATDVAAGASFRFRLLFIVLLSNIFAIFLQSLCVKLGSVTGMNLAENCKAHLPKWLNISLYIFAEAAIIATDIAEVIGTAIALNVLLHIPLVAGCAISIVDVLIILFFYNPSGSMRALRAFEFFVILLVLGVVICFGFQLSLIKHTSVGEVFRGYLPSSAIVKSKGIYQSCGILGATVMPHSLYLGSGMCQPRLREFDMTNNTISLSSTSNTITATTTTSTTSQPATDTDDTDSLKPYRPSLRAIRACLTYSTVELALSLFTFALFVNSAILIVAGASLSSVPDAASADLFAIHDLLASTLTPAAGTIFALALLLSGTSAGIVCTIAGQMVSEGQLGWNVRPWVRRLVTRSISITPSIVIAGAVGREGLSAALGGSQVALSVILPFVSAPLLWFTCRNKYMTVVAEEDGEGEAEGAGVAGSHMEGRAGNGRRTVGMRNHWVTAAIALLIWGIIVVMNVALLVLVGLGVE